MKQETNLNLADIDLKTFKLSDEDALALSYLTPGLSRRIQKQLFAQISPSEMKKIQRTLSSRNSSDGRQKDDQKFVRRSVDRLSSLPKKFPTDNINQTNNELLSKISTETEQKISYGQSPQHLDYYQATDFGYRRPKTMRSFSLREPKIYQTNKIIDKSPDSSLSESLSKNDSTSELSYSSSFSRPSSSNLNKYSTSTTRSLIPCSLDKTDLKASSSSTNPRRISRFLRADFFDTPKEESVLNKEKKERELETQKVLKEIRDKRKMRYRRDRSVCRKDDEIKTNNNDNNESTSLQHDYVNVVGVKNDNNKDFVVEQKIHDYVNVNTNEQIPVNKKERVSKLIRPKSYPTDDKTKDKDSKLGKLRSIGQTTKSSSTEKTKDDKNEINEEKSHKNKLLHSIERKLEKFRSNKDKSSSSSDTVNSAKEKNTNIENAIKKLREQSLPRNLQHCTESGLIKRAVSVENLPNLNKPLQASKKSVTKILGLFKKYEEQDVAKNNDKVKKKKLKETVINNDSSQNDTEKKLQRPRSLFLDRINKTFQNGGKTNDVDKETKISKPLTSSKLPVNTFRRSLNLDNVEPPKFYKYPTTCNNDGKPDRSKLKLDLSEISKDKVTVTNPGSSGLNDINNDNYRNSLATTDSSSLFLSPSCDDNLSCSSSWSVCSDLHQLHLPVSPNGNTTLNQYNNNSNIYSGDESESVSERIRRKSFYSRFNEKKRPRRSTSLSRSYDLYGSSLNRTNSFDFKLPSTSRHFHHQDTKKYPSINDYVNVPNRYNSSQIRLSSPSSSIMMAYSDSEDNNNNNALMDDYLLAAKSRKYSSSKQHPASSTHNRTSVSHPGNQYYLSRPRSAVMSDITSPTSSETF